MLLETDRIILRKMQDSDFADLCEILTDKDVMYAYEHAFSLDEATKWLNNQFARYEKSGYGLMAIIDKKSGEFVGQAGITLQAVKLDENTPHKFDFPEEVAEIGYLLKKKFWHQGYATESAVALKKYAFEVLNLPYIVSIIRNNNLSSQNVAKRNGMQIGGIMTKFYQNIYMPHFIFYVENKTSSNKK